jgi:hypothetical protein
MAMLIFFAAATGAGIVSSDLRHITANGFLLALSSVGDMLALWNTLFSTISNHGYFCLTRHIFGTVVEGFFQPLAGT